MRDPTTSEVEPLSLKWLALISLGTFALVFLLLEVLDPRLIGIFRAPPPPASAAISPSAPGPRSAAQPTRPAPTLRPFVPAAGPVSTPSPSPSPPDKATLNRAGAGLRQVVVVETEGQGARLRSNPAAEAELLGVLEEGATVELTGRESEAQDRLWIEVRASDGLTGWVAADFLAEPAPAGMLPAAPGPRSAAQPTPPAATPEPPGPEATPPEPTPELPVPEATLEEAPSEPTDQPEDEPPERAGAGLTQAVVVETEGQGAQLRADPHPEAEVLGLLEEGATVELTGRQSEAEERVWREVRAADGLSGWVAADFLAPAEP